MCGDIFDLTYWIYCEKKQEYFLVVGKTENNSKFMFKHFIEPIGKELTEILSNYEEAIKLLEVKKLYDNKKQILSLFPGNIEKFIEPFLTPSTNFETKTENDKTIEQSLQMLTLFYFLRNFKLSIDTNYDIENETIKENCKELNINFKELSKNEKVILSRLVSGFNELKLPASNKTLLKIENNSIKFIDDVLFEQTQMDNEELNEAMRKTVYSNFIEVQRYQIETLEDYLSVLMNDVFVNNITICKCKNCGKYFIPKGSTRIDVKYCDNPSPQNKEKKCIEIGASKTYKSKIKSDPILYEDNKCRQRYRMKIKRKKDTSEKEALKKELNNYIKEYDKICEKLCAGDISEEDVINWIKKQG